MGFRLSKSGIGFIAAHEAVYLFAYPDPGTNGDPWTIGAGHTRHAGPPLPTPGDVISLPRALEILVKDLEKYCLQVNASVGAFLSKQHEFDSLVSFHFNTGAISSGSVDDKLKRGDQAGAMATLQAYNKGGGRVLKGLVTRRAEERALFERGIYPGRLIAIVEKKGAKARYVRPENLPWPAGFGAGNKSITLNLDLQPDTTPPDPPKNKGNFIIDIFRYVTGW